MQEGSSIELATVGREGLVGHYDFGGRTSPHHVVALLGYSPFRMRSQALHDLAEQGSPLCQLLTAYHVAFMAQVSQPVACNGLHRLELRCWLAADEPRPGGVG
jgi:hypothetical protein